MSGRLQLGTARIEITPSYPVPLAGFAHRSGAFERIHSPLFLRALLFAQDLASGADTSALVISTDLFCWGPDLAAAVSYGLSRRLGIPLDSVILHATHNHSGPQTSRLFSPSLGAADDRYLELLKNTALRAAGRALQNLEPVTVERGSGRCDFGIHRRKAEGGTIRMAPNADGPVDSELTVARFRSLEGAPKALLVHYTCHPTASGANEVCGEYPGLAMAALERDTPLVAAFLQGCCGDVRPALIRDGEFYRGNPGDAGVLAQTLAREIHRILEAGMEPCPPSALAASRRETSLPLAALPSLDELDRVKDSSDIFGEWSRLLLAEPGRLTWSPALESIRLDLAGNLGLLTFNAEMVVAYGLYTKEVSLGRLLPVAYTNGMVGYVPTRRQIEEGGYESAEAFRYYGYQAAFADTVEAAAREHIRVLAR